MDCGMEFQSNETVTISIVRFQEMLNGIKNGNEVMSALKSIVKLDGNNNLSINENDLFIFFNQFINIFVNGKGINNLSIVRSVQDDNNESNKQEDSKTMNEN